MRALFQIALATLLAASAQAQAIEWEPMPLKPEVGKERGVVEFVPALDGVGTVAGHDLLMATGSRFYRYTPGRGDLYDGDWEQVSWDGARVGLKSTTGAILGSGASARAVRSDDGQGNYVMVFHSAFSAMMQSRQPGLVGAGGHGAILGVNGGQLWVSLDDGRQGTWEKRGYLGRTRDLDQVPPSDSLPQGRLLAATSAGVVASDDLGHTWYVTEGSYEIGYGSTLAFAPEPGHPYGGAVLGGFIDAVLPDRNRRAIVARSDDGGASWREIWRYDPDEWGDGDIGTNPHLFAGPDGAVWMSVYRRIGPGPYPSRLLRSTDSGATWHAADAGLASVPIGSDAALPVVEVLAMTGGPDGRIYAGTGWGVWRTTEPVFAVAGEAAPELDARLAVAVHPNPTGGRATVSVSLAAPERVRLAVFDVQGREVAVIHQGPASDGERFQIETGALAPGAYVVRVTSASGAAAAGLTVMR